MSVDPVSGIISGTPNDAAGTYMVAISAINTSGPGAATPALALTGSPSGAVPTVTIVVAAGNGAPISGGAKSKVLFARTGDTSANLTVRDKVQGSAKAGTDYKPLPDVVTLSAGAASTKVKVKTLANPAVDGLVVAKVKLLPALDGGYNLGSAVVAKIKISD